MKHYFITLISILFISTASAQNNKEKIAYGEEAARLRTEIWGSPTEEFKALHNPASLNKESAIVLARSLSLSRSSSGKIKFGRALVITTHTAKFTIFHERVKINDKTALESFSTLEYQKKLDKSTSELFAKFAAINNTYVGAKVIKPGGKEIEINTSEEVLIENGTKDQKGKLAIPELQVGDILDYYVCQQEIMDKDEGNTYKDNDNIIFLADEYPVLSYSLDFQFNKKLNVRVVYANGAQHFEESHNNEGDQIFNLKVHNIPKYPGHLWTSSAREFPYIEIASAYDDKIDKIITKNKLQGPAAMLEAQKTVFEEGFSERLYLANGDPITYHYKDYFKDKKTLKTISLDSSMKVLYAEWKYETFCNDWIGGIDKFPSLKYRKANGKVNATLMCMILTELKINFDILLVSSRYSNTLDNVVGYDDFDAAIRINGDKPMYMFFDEIETQFDQIPERYQGEQVIVLHPKRRSGTEYTFTEEAGVLPVSSARQNYLVEQLNISIADTKMQKLKIDRLVTESGSLRFTDQQLLLGMRNIEDELGDVSKREKFDQKHDPKEAQRHPKSYGAAIRNNAEKEDAELIKSYNTEIKEKFGQEPEQATNCSVISYGLDQSRPTFTYKETFLLNNLVKKAGNNYIIDAGKLTGGFLKLEDKDKGRDNDIYMPAARGFEYVLSIDIPGGYSAKGVEELIQSKSNKTGSFSSVAEISGNKLVIKVKRIYNHNFEKAADWPALVEIINIASDFDSKKVLLEKQN